MLTRPQFRHQLELDPDNAATLAAIDASAFVLCLDDESPSNAGERTRRSKGCTPVAVLILRDRLDWLRNSGGRAACRAGW